VLRIPELRHTQNWNRLKPGRESRGRSTGGLVKRSHVTVTLVPNDADQRERCQGSWN
jgi:hypothetical protein